jgi:hypothetical protein
MRRLGSAALVREIRVAVDGGVVRLDNLALTVR